MTPPLSTLSCVADSVQHHEAFHQALIRMSKDSESIDTGKVIIMLVYFWGRGNDDDSLCEKSELNIK